jgi:hydrogenase maturation factor
MLGSVVAPSCDPDHCITCADDGVAMLVIEFDEDTGLALCEQQDGRRAAVDPTLVAPVRAGSVVLVHAGVAIAALREHGPAPEAGTRR